MTSILHPRGTRVTSDPPRRRPHIPSPRLEIPHDFLTCSTCICMCMHMHKHKHGHNPHSIHFKVHPRPESSSEESEAESPKPVHEPETHHESLSRPKSGSKEMSRELDGGNARRMYLSPCSFAQILSQRTRPSRSRPVGLKGDVRPHGTTSDSHSHSGPSDFWGFAVEAWYC